MKTIAEQQEEYRARLASGMWPDQALEGSLRMLAEIARLRAELETVTAERDRYHRKYEGACATIEDWADASDIELTSESGYEGSHYMRIAITYERNETATEKAEREARYAEQQAGRAEERRHRYEELKKEFGS